MADRVLLVPPCITRPIRALPTRRHRSPRAWLGASATLAGHSGGGSDCAPGGSSDRGVVWRGGGLARPRAAAAAGEIWCAVGSRGGRDCLEGIASVGRQ